MLNPFGAAMGGQSDSAFCSSTRPSRKRALNAAAAIASLADSLADATAPVERRREAAERLRDLLADYPSAQAAVGSAGLPALATALRHQPRDLETLRAVLECLSSALEEANPTAAAAAAANAAAAEFQQTIISPAAINCELFSRDQANVSELLSLLSSPQQLQQQQQQQAAAAAATTTGFDFTGQPLQQQQAPPALDPNAAAIAADLGVRYHATATLAALAASHAPRLASAILSMPGGVGLLLDLLSDSHGAVAGEARPLLLRLARAAPEVQKIAAFEGAFERLLGGARAAASPGVGEPSVAQDYLDLAAALVERNPVTQVLFREGGHTAALLPLLTVDDRAGSENSNNNNRAKSSGVTRLTPQRAVVICAAIDLLMALVWPGESDDGGGGGGGSGGGASNSSSIATPSAAAEAAKARLANQDALLQYGAVQSLLSLCMDNGGVPDDVVRVKAMTALGVLVQGNAGAQTSLARTNITVVGKPLPVVQALLRTALRAPSPAERAAGDGVLRRLCVGNEQVQLELLGTISPVEPGSVPSNFGQELVRGLLNADPTLAVPSSSVAASLIRGSTRAKVYMLQLPVEAAPGTGGPHRLVLPTLASTISSYFDVQGAPQEEHARPLATAAASLLVEWLDECPKAVSALLACPGWVDATSAAVIERPLPCDDSICCLSAVLLGLCMLHCGEDVQSQAVSKDIIMSRVGLAKYFGALGRLQSLVSLENPASHFAFSHEMRTFLSNFESKFQNFLVAPASVAAAQQQHPDPAHQAPSSAVSDLTADVKRLQEAQATISALESQLQQARLSSAAPVSANGGSATDVAALQKQCAELQAAADAARAEAEASAAAAKKFESDLQDLAGAYAGLEAHAQDLEARVAGLGSGNGGPAASTTATNTNTAIPTAAEIEKKIKEAADAARAEGEAELDDLLACLGEEERKVEVLTAKLAEFGVDAAALHAASAPDDAKKASSGDDLT